MTNSDQYTCGQCGYQWSYGTPASRCPREYEHTTNSTFDHYIVQAIKTHRVKFDPSQLAEKFIPYFQSRRIKVITIYNATDGAEAETYTRFGIVAMTGGWRPSFILMHRSSDLGSSDVLSDRDMIVAEQHANGKYYPYRNPL